MNLPALLDAHDLPGARALVLRQPAVLASAAPRVRATLSAGGGTLWGLEVWPGVDASGAPTASISVGPSLPSGCLCAELGSGVLPLERAVPWSLALLRLVLLHADTPLPRDPAGAAALIEAGGLSDLLDMGCHSALSRAARVARLADQEDRLAEALSARVGSQARTRLGELEVRFHVLDAELYAELQELEDEPPVICCDPPPPGAVRRYVILGELAGHATTESYLLGEHGDAVDDPDALLTEDHIRMFCRAVVDQR